MADLIIKKRQAGDVTILDLEGQIRIGEGSVALRDAIGAVVEAGRSKVVLNLARVSYIDSSGIGEMVVRATMLQKIGGELRIAYLTHKVQDLLTITKLLSVFDCYDDIKEAVKSFQVENTYFVCPIYRCGNQISFSYQKGQFELCGKCGAKLFAKRRSSRKAGVVSITSIRIPSYDEEYIEISPGAPTIIKVVGRLDLFASEVLERAWLTVPSPRRVVFQFGAGREITLAGMQKVVALCSSKEAGARAVILTKAKKVKSLVAADAPVYGEKQKATEALGVSNDGGWILDLAPVSR